MNTTFDKTELSYTEKEFIYNTFSNDNQLDVDSLCAKYDIKLLASALFLTGTCIAGILCIVLL